MTSPEEQLHVHVNGRFLTQPVTGVQRYGAELVAAIDRLLAASDPVTIGLRVTVHVPEGEPLRDLPVSVVAVVRRGRGRGHVWEQLALPRQVRDGVLFCPGNTAPVAALLCGTPVVVTVHDLSFRYFPEAYGQRFRWWYEVLTPLIMSRASQVVTVSESERAGILRHYPGVRARLRVVQNGGGVSSGAAAELGPRSGSPELPARYVLYVGSLSRRKNFPGVIAAFGRLAAEDETLCLVVAGAVTSAFRAAPLELPEAHRSRVVFLGQVNDTATLAGLYRQAACFVFPSYYEASPLPPVEAMSFGCPVVASSIPSLHERCGDAAEYCEAGDAESIAAAVRRVLADPALADRLRARGRQRAELFTWDGAARSTLSVLREAGPARRRGWFAAARPQLARSDQQWR
ncbi:MAG TPA: glycosyltransferase family 1 protein [Gemmatimonadales bacterium]|nr:glycosyltransferase family 1 protein [Gemmatimonadales bacterium]